ncbi:HD domain-containing phosphohydrolase [Anaerosinus sp.]
MSQIILKRYPLAELKAGMIVGKTIHDHFERELITKGTILTKQIIDALATYFVSFVTIAEALPEDSGKPIENIKFSTPKIKVAATLDAYVIDQDFVESYYVVFDALKQLFSISRYTGNINQHLLAQLVNHHFFKLSDGFKAITHLHNLSRDGYYLLHHSINVAILSGVLGRWLHLPKQELHNLIIAGLLHDIGKTQIDKELLNKPGKLTPIEFKEVKQHSKKGFDILQHTKLFENKDILLGVLQHHERLDGSGYPLGVTADKIHKFAKIIAIADIYDAMASNKVYAGKKNPFDIFTELSNEMTNKLDTHYCVLFIKNVCHAMIGNWAKLSNGMKVKIIYIDETRISSLPIVQSNTGDFIDLNKENDITIVELLSATDNETLN